MPRTSKPTNSETLYAFDTAADAAPEMQEVWQEVFGQLSLVDLTA